MGLIGERAHIEDALELEGAMSLYLISICRLLDGHEELLTQLRGDVNRRDEPCRSDENAPLVVLCGEHSRLTELAHRDAADDEEEKREGRRFLRVCPRLISIVCLYPSRVSIFNYDLLEVQKREDFDKTNRRHNSFFFVFFFNIFIMCNQ